MDGARSIRPTRCRAPRRWPLLGLLLVLAFLAHDAGMAGNVHPAAAHAHRLSMHTPMEPLQRAHAGSVPKRDIHASLDAPDTCATIRRLVSAPAFGRFEPHEAVAVTVPALRDPPILHRQDGAGATALPPPRMRRALLQVYRL